jgi:hypothetical protein
MCILKNFPTYVFHLWLKIHDLQYAGFSLVTIATKRGIVDKYMEFERFNEEIGLIHEEMIRFLTFYIRRKFPELQRKRNSLKYILEGISVNLFLNRSSSVLI